MRACHVVCLVLCLALAAHAAEPGRVTCDLREVPLSDALAKAAAGVKVEDPAGLARTAGPVTYKAQDRPLDLALVEMLRPRGIEFLWLAEDRVRLVPAACALGVTKQAGRGLRVFAALAAKLEKAVQEGDEVRVPGWTADDDDALARAVIDFAGAVAFYEARRDPPAPAARDEVMRVLDAPDRDARVGLVLPVGHGWFDPGLGGPPEGIAGRLTPLAQDPDPDVRAAGVFMATAGARRTGGGDIGDAVLAKALRDPDARVRFVAAAVAMMLDRRSPVPADAAAVARDESAAVRFLVSFYSMAQRQDHAPLVACLKDPNPIVRGLAVFMSATVMHGEQRRKDLKEALDAADDPWLKVCARLAQPLLDGQGRPRPDPGPMLAQLAEMLRSPKPSHRVLAAFSVPAGFLLLGRQAIPGGIAGPPPPAPQDLPHGDPNLWVRLASLALASMPGAPEAEATLARAMKSANEPERLLAMLLMMMQREMRPGRGMPLTPVPQSVREALEVSARSGIYAEQTLAASVLSSVRGLDEALAVLAAEAARDPPSAAISEMAARLARHPELRPGNPQETIKRWDQVLDKVLAIPNDAAQTAVVQAAQWQLGLAGADGRHRLMERVLLQARPAAVAAALRQHQAVWAIRNNKLLGPFCQRLDKLFQEGDPESRRQAALALSALVEVLTRMFTLRELGDEAGVGQAKDLLTRMAVWAFEKPETTALGFQLLEAIAPGSRMRPALPLTEAPPELRRVAAAAMGKVKEPAHAAAAARLVSGALRWTVWEGKPLAEVDPGLAQAVQEARRHVMAEGSPSDQVQVLMGLAEGTADAERGPAAVELQRRFQANAVPADLLVPATLALVNNPSRLTPEFMDFALDQLDRQPGNPAWAASLRDLVIAAARTARAQPADRPPWVAKAARLAGARFRDKAAVAHERAAALRMYARTADDGVAAVAAVLRDGQEDQAVRRAAADVLIEIDPATTLFKDLAEPQVFAALPWGLRVALGRSAASATRAPAAQDFVIAFLKSNPEDRQRYEMTQVLHAIQLPETPELREAVEALTKDRFIGHAAQFVLQHRWRRPAVAPQPGPVQPKAIQPDFEKQVAALKDAAWKKEDPIEKHLTWYALKPGVAVVDSQARSVTQQKGLLAAEQVNLSGIAFDARRVWMGAEIGLIAWDRRAKFYSLMAVGGAHLDRPVASLEMKETTLLVTVRLDGDRTETWQYDTAASKWTRAAAQP